MLSFANVGVCPDISKEVKYHAAPFLPLLDFLCHITLHFRERGRHYERGESLLVGFITSEREVMFSFICLLP